MDIQSCPFCGSADKPRLIEKEDGGMPGSGIIYAYVECSCKARGPSFADWGNPDYKMEAMTAWNRRNTST
ncbi:Lar family restriction alleviation protein [Pseudomonas sp. ChxA]|uniref:Lar family restriction alleviation protein n=1 Tax=Pseudomonas sp. ChxA TaxID=3035473 RepID=UPI00332DD35C